MSSNRFFGTPSPADDANAPTQPEKSNLDMLSETAITLSEEGTTSPFPTAPTPAPTQPEKSDLDMLSKTALSFSEGTLRSPAPAPASPIPKPSSQGFQTVYFSPSESPSESPPPPPPRTSSGNQSAPRSQSQSQSPKGEETASNRVADFFNPKGIFLQLSTTSETEMNFLFEGGQINNVKVSKWAKEITLETACFNITFKRNSYANLESFFYLTPEDDECYKNIIPPPTTNKASFLMDFFIAVAALLNCKYIELTDASNKVTKLCSFPLQLNQYIPPFRTYYEKWGYISTNLQFDIHDIDDYVQKIKEMQQISLQLSEKPISSFAAFRRMKDKWHYIDKTPDSFETTNVRELCLLLKKICSSPDVDEETGSTLHSFAARDTYKQILSSLREINSQYVTYRKYIYSCSDNERRNYKTVEMVSMTGTLFEKTKTTYKWSTTEQGYRIETVRAKRRSQIFQGYTLNHDPASWIFDENFLLCEGTDDETFEPRLFKIYFKFYGNAVIGASETFATYRKSMYGLEYEKTIYDKIFSLQSRVLDTHVLTYVTSLKNTSICQPPLEQIDPQIRTWLENISKIERNWIDYLECVKATVFVFEKGTQKLSTYLKSTENATKENEVSILFQLLWAVRELHARGIVKNNITADNVYISSTWPVFTRKNDDGIYFGVSWKLPKDAPRVILTDWTLANVEPELKKPQLNPSPTKPAKNMLLTPGMQYCDQKKLCFKNDIQRDISDCLTIFKYGTNVGRFIRSLPRSNTIIVDLLKSDLFSEMKR